jgi:hypothetical protein
VRVAGILVQRSFEHFDDALEVAHASLQICAHDEPTFVGQSKYTCHGAVR